MLATLLAVSQFVLGGGVPLVQCRGADGHVQAEWVHRECGNPTTDETNEPATDEHVAESSSCSDTPLRTHQLVQSRSSLDRGVVQAMLGVHAVVCFALFDQPTGAAECPIDSGVIPDAQLCSLRTVVLTV